MTPNGGSTSGPVSWCSTLSEFSQSQLPLLSKILVYTYTDNYTFKICLSRKSKLLRRLDVITIVRAVVEIHPLRRVTIIRSNQLSKRQLPPKNSFTRTPHDSAEPDWESDNVLGWNSHQAAS